MKSQSLGISSTILKTVGAEPTSATAPSAKTREHHGRVLVVAGAVLATLGVAVYCLMMLISELNHGPAHFLTEALLMIGAGLAIWLYGVFKHLNALIDMGPSDDDAL